LTNHKLFNLRNDQLAEINCIVNLTSIQGRGAKYTLKQESLCNRTLEQLVFLGHHL